MNEVLLNLIGHYGYPALFFALWLGIIGMPIPDEVVVMTGGFVTAVGLLAPVPAFILTYLGVVSGLSLGYVLGHRLGAPVLERLVKKKKAGKYLIRAQELLGRFGHYALVISYFFPVVRHLVPYLVGIGKISYRKYATYSYSTGFLWTLVYFVLGRLFGNHIERIASWVTEYGWYGLAILSLTGLVLWRLKRTNKFSPSI